MKSFKETGPGVYLILSGCKPGWGKPLPQPKEILPAIEGSLGKSEWEDVVGTITRLSANHNAWCGVTWPRLVIEAMQGDHNHNSLPLRVIVEAMAEDGLLEICGRNTFWRIITFKDTSEIICLTPKIFERLLGRLVQIPNSQNNPTS
ncbi:MAG: hypothetical protein NT162_00525 [Candidatus Woesebacteria bacterium]|nr:hypothetical protein [Candidatus Woesebacteria bacterium]